MSKKWNELYAKLSPERRARIEQAVEEELAQMKQQELVQGSTQPTPGDPTVLSWLENIRKEANGGALLLLVGGKVLCADGWLRNLAYAVKERQ